jgi:N-acetylglucosamine-6-phosphate deacetylase
MGEIYMRIENVLVYAEDKKFHTGSIIISGDKFADSVSALNDDVIIDGQGCYAIPGLVDVHFHGCMGADFCDGTKDAVQTIADYEASQGVTTIVPATMTLPEDVLMTIMKTAAGHENESGAYLAGINMEGPFISSAKKGAQAATHIRKPDVEMFQRLQKESNGMIRLCDIAPEEDGAMEFIKTLKDEVKISFAHTMASYNVAKKGLFCGRFKIFSLNSS